MKSIIQIALFLFPNLIWAQTVNVEGLSLEFGTYAKYKNYFSKNNPNIRQYWQNNNTAVFYGINADLAKRTNLSLTLNRCYLTVNILDDSHGMTIRKFHSFRLTEIPLMLSYQIKSLPNRFDVSGIFGISYNIVHNPHFKDSVSYWLKDTWAHQFYHRRLTFKTGVKLTRWNKSHNNCFSLAYLIEYVPNPRKSVPSKYPINTFTDNGFSSNLMLSFNFNLFAYGK